MDTLFQIRAPASPDPYGETDMTRTPRHALLGVLLGAFTLTLPFAAAQDTAAPAAPAAPADRAFLGLYTESISDDPNTFGLRVTHVVHYSSASRIGIQLGDVVLTVNDVLLSTPEDLGREIQGLNINSRIRFNLKRGDEKLRLEGKLGSLQQTMAAYQSRVRKQQQGKPFPKPPAMVWWNPEKKEFEERKEGLSSLHGIPTILFSFDDCSYCQRHKYNKFGQLQKQLASLSTPDVQIAGIFFKEGATKEESTELLKKLLAATPFDLPLAVAFYPEPTKFDRDRNAVLHRHGTAVLDAEGKVTYVQIYGALESEFVQAYQATLMGAGKTSTEASGN